jgi:hypothetical protein
MLLVLAACGSGEKGSESSGILGGGGGAMEPGEWEMTMETVNVSAPNLPPEALAQMKRPPVTSRTCMSAEEAKGPKPDTFTGNAGGANCKTEGFSWAGGKIKGTTTCSPPGGGKMTMAMDGDYGPNSMTMNMKTSTEAQGMTMNMDARITGKRIGDCPAGKENS